ncbi:uroporphyrinogen-III synthase [Psychrobacter sp. I-STPA6b]|uniref:uroporphyrinogen-III synthase n=1 Tax=Psychrobacter sp. I-STPA6b TaxID=2585718 RepID=UPI001D0C567C|nr:uroporphyrinogen-III synthase [Psychrobacter sp. I-STPA6b]
MQFVNTRPASRAVALSQALHQAGVQVYDMPLLTLDTLDLSDKDKRCMGQLLNSEYQVLVVVSPSAARMGLAQCPYDYVPDYPVIAVGEATAKILRQRGWQVQCPDESSNEGMLNMPMIQQLSANSRVFIWRGAGGRRLLVDCLRERGIQVDIVEWYERRCPQSLSEDYQQLCEKMVGQQDTPMVVLISSGEAFIHWQTVVESQKMQVNMPVAAPSLSSFYYFVLGERLSQRLQALGLQYSQLQSLQSQHILDYLYTLDK